MTQLMVGMAVAILGMFIGVEAPVQDQEKVTICHIPPGNPDNAHTITISIRALPAHQEQHGDKIGECDGGGGS